VDIQAYIQSGIIESYVLGMTSTEEAAEVEVFRTQYKAVENAIHEFSLIIEAGAFETAIKPPPSLKQSILATLKKEGLIREDILTVPAPQEEARVYRLTRGNSWRTIAAAAVILLIVSAGVNYYLFREYNNKKQEYQALLAERQTLLANSEIYQTQLKEWQTAAKMMADTGMSMVKLRSNKGKDDAATIFWNTKNRDVYLMVNKLPEPTTGKQYQLWAMVDGQPVNAGLLDPQCTSVCKMKNIPRADAFAITLEKEGGSAMPNLRSLFVIGSV